MGISSLGVGSSILTQDVLDQLRKADEAAQIKPIDYNIANENDKKEALKLIDANMTNLTDSINEIKSHGLFDERKTTISGSAVSVSADANSDIQDFTLDVSVLATKQIEESGAFTAEDEKIADGDGKINLNIDGEDFEIVYDDTTTLKDLKKLINDIAGDKVDATIVQIKSDEFRLFISSVDTGTSQDITLTDMAGEGENLKDTRLTDDMSAVQTAVDAEFTFNGQDITRKSNDIDDLITGLDITLKNKGTSVVNVTQDRDSIMKKFDSFITHYNSTITELDKMTISSTESETRGIFSNESTIKNMKRAIEDTISSIGGSVGSMLDYGFDVDKDGKLTLDKDVLNKKLDDNSSNVEIFFAGGDFDNGDDTTTTVDGAFTEFSEVIEGYTKYNAILDLFETSIKDNLSSLEGKKTKATERLDAKYEIMKKQYIAYDLMISKLNSASSMFTQMVNTENNN